MESVAVSAGSGVLPSPGFWHDKRVFLTGHTGFKGAWLALWLEQLGARVAGYSLAPIKPSLFEWLEPWPRLESTLGDIRNRSALETAITAFAPEILIHMASQAIVQRSYRDPVGTISVNIEGTSLLLEIMRQSASTRAILVVTSDKVYANRKAGRRFTESDPLGGDDPYSASKAAQDMIAHSFAASFFDQQAVPVATARAGNVVGGGDFAEDRLVPDIFRAIERGKPIELRNPKAARPWQHVLDCLCGYLVYAEHLTKAPASSPRTLNFGPSLNQQDVSVAAFAEAMIEALGKPAIWRQSVDSGFPEKAWLGIDPSLAETTLGWRARLTGASLVSATSDWYRALIEGRNMRSYSLECLRQYAASSG
jgi:CDP-glucose 4,6-dehydratase